MKQSVLESILLQLFMSKAELEWLNEWLPFFKKKKKSHGVKQKKKKPVESNKLHIFTIFKSVFKYLHSASAFLSLHFITKTSAFYSLHATPNHQVNQVFRITQLQRADLNS